MSNTADVIIVGAGVHGASLAFHLAQRGLKPIVLEKDFTGAGATGRSSGLVRMHNDIDVESQLGWESFQYFRNWADVVGAESGFSRTDFLQIVLPAENETLRANIEMQQHIGVPTFLITSDDVRRLAPHFNVDDFELAAYEPESGYSDPTGTTSAFMAAARVKGARLVQDCEVTGIQV